MKSWTDDDDILHLVSPAETASPAPAASKAQRHV